MTTPTFGNLTFSHYAPTTEAERQVLSLQAALTLLSVPDKPTVSLKKLLRLKKAMQKNKLRKYTFDLVPVARPSAAPLPVKEQEATDQVAVVSSAICSLTGLHVQSSQVKVATSGHLILNLQLLGSLADYREDPEIKKTITKMVKRNHSDVIHSFILQTLSVFKTTEVNMEVQCVYKVVHAST